MYTVSQKKMPQLTQVIFNPVQPIVLVGDSRGTVTCLKLSPNLRKALRVSIILIIIGFNLFQEKNRTPETECAKMDKLISFVNEPLVNQETS